MPSHQPDRRPLTLFNRWALVARRLLPRPLATLVRRVGTALLAPGYFSIATGHLRSSLLGRPVDARGEPIPWYTYPAIEFLSRRDFRSRSVLELGGGHSTLWWGHRAQRVVTYEADPGWLAGLRSRAPPTVSLRQGELRLDLDGALGDQRFDIIVIDGLDRYHVAALAPRHLAPGGGPLVDNTDAPWGRPDAETIPALMSRLSFARVDFHGHSPGVLHPQCTSLFFSGRCFLLEDAELNGRELLLPRAE